MSIYLADVRVQITIYWQPSDRHWYLDIHAPQGEAILRGRRLVGGGQRVINSSFSTVDAGHKNVLPDLTGTISCTGVGPPARDAWGHKTHRLIFEN